MRAHTQMLSLRTGKKRKKDGPPSAWPSARNLRCAASGCVAAASSLSARSVVSARFSRHTAHALTHGGVTKKQRETRSDRRVTGELMTGAGRSRRRQPSREMAREMHFPRLGWAGLWVILLPAGEDPVQLQSSRPISSPEEGCRGMYAVEAV